MASTDQHSAKAQSVHSAYDPEPEPSADWGWHGGFPRAGKAAGWLTAIAMFAMLIGNHRSHVEDAYLVGIGSALVVALIASHLKDHRAKRR
ncbi:MAG TPA: DUF2631 domain-containing protein [Pseudonocardiaceae bacterium]|nr:DUF2631 domain-containing protein [Pseudonocardiaceae bacterium]